MCWCPQVHAARAGQRRARTAHSSGAGNTGREGGRKFEARSTGGERGQGTESQAGRRAGEPDVYEMNLGFQKPQGCPQRTHGAVPASFCPFYCPALLSPLPPSPHGGCEAPRPLPPETRCLQGSGVLLRPRRRMGEAMSWGALARFSHPKLPPTLHSLCCSSTAGGAGGGGSHTASPGRHHPAPQPSAVLTQKSCLQLQPTQLWPWSSAPPPIWEILRGRAPQDEGLRS